MMYSQVPPPDQLCSEAASSSPSPNIAQKDAIDYSKPEHVASHQWKVGSDSTHTLLSTSLGASPFTRKEGVGTQTSMELHEQFC